MKCTLLFLPLFLILSSCSGDIPISSEYRAWLAPYELALGDTLYFESQQADVDTCVVVMLDSIQVKNSFMCLPYKEISVKIRHLPYHHWKGSGRVGTKPPQQLFSIYKKTESKGCYFQYRDFSARMDSLVPPIQDTLLQELGIKEYWKLEDDYNWKEDSTASVETIIWTKELGLTAYYKKDGSYYVLRKRPFK